MYSSQGYLFCATQRATQAPEAVECAKAVGVCRHRRVASALLALSCLAHNASSECLYCEDTDKAEMAQEGVMQGGMAVGRVEARRGERASLAAAGDGKRAQA